MSWDHAWLKQHGFQGFVRFAELPRPPVPVPIAVLQAAWVPAAHVLNIGKAALGASGRRCFKRGPGEYRQYGAGQPVGHAGGRYIWQLADASQLLVAWLQTPGHDPKLVEDAFIVDFARHYGKRPFANLTGGYFRCGTRITRG